MSEQKHWLYRQENLPKLWVIQIVILVLAVLPEFFIKHKEHLPGSGFTLDTTFGFFAWYGFLTCAAMVVGAKILGIFLKRKDTYYDPENHTPENHTPENNIPDNSSVKTERNTNDD